MADSGLPRSQAGAQGESRPGSQPALRPGDEGSVRLVLALDTCGPASTLALAELAGDEVCLLREGTLPARTAGSMLTGAIRDLLGATQPAELHAVVVVRGPGSFTGMRIGLSAAKALAEACALPLVAVSRLAVLSAAHHAPLVALDAGRGRVYLGDLERTSAPECLLDRGSLLEYLLETDRCREVLDAMPRRSVGNPERCLTVCEARLASLFPAAVCVPPPTALDALRYAAARLAARDWDDAATLDALYLWRAEQMLTGPAHSG